MDRCPRIKGQADTIVESARITGLNEDKDGITVMIRNNETGVECWINIMVFDEINAKQIVLKKIGEHLEREFGICNVRQTKA
jgi:hypothetical protein